MLDTIDKSLGYTDYHFRYAEQVGNYNGLKTLLGKSAALTAPRAPATDVPPKSLADIYDQSEDAPSTTSFTAVPDKLTSFGSASGLLAFAWKFYGNPQATAASHS